MKTFFKRFGKIASYALAYILITLGTAVGIIFLSPAGENGKNDGVYIAPQLSHIYENFTEVDYLQLVDLKAEIETPTSNFTLLLNAELDLTQGLTDMAVNGVLTVLVDEQEIPINFNYGNGVIYVEVLNGKFRIDTSNLGESFNQILSILNVQIPDLGFNLNSLNPNDILAMLSDLTETKGENTITLNINVPVVGSIKLVCDLNYSIREVSMPKTTISQGTSISFSSKLAYEDIAVEKPQENDFIEATYLFNVLGATLDYINQDEIGFDIDVKYENIALNGNFSANLKDFSAKYSMMLLDTPINLVAKENVLYFEIGNIYTKFALSDAGLINEFLAKNFDITLPISEIVAILEALSKGSLFDVIPSLDLGSGNTDVSEIDLSIIQSFDKNENEYILTLRELGCLRFGIENKALTFLGFQGFNIDASLTMTKPASIALATLSEAYIDLKHFLPVADAFIETMKQPSFVGNGTIKLSDLDAELYFQVNTANSLRVHLELSLYDEIAKLDLQDNTLFLQFKDVKLQASINDIDTVKDFLTQTFGIVMTDTDVSKLLDEIKMLINPEFIPSLIKSVVEIDNGLTITLYNDLAVTIRYTSVVNGLDIEFDNLAVNIDLIASENVEIETLDPSEYTLLTDLLPIISSVKEYVENGQFYLTIAADFDYNNESYHIDGSINYDENGISMYAQTTIQGINIQVKFKDNIIYAEIAGLKLMFNLSDLDKVLEFAQNTLGLDVDGLTNELKDKIEDLMSNSKDFDIKAFINTLALSLSKDEFTVSLPEAVIKVVFENSKLSTLMLNAQGFTLNAFVNDYASTLDINGEYCNISDLLPIADMLISYFTSKQYNISASAQVYDQRTQIYNADNITLQVDFTNKLQFYADALVTGIEDTKSEGFKMAINAALQDDYLYVDYNNLLIKLNSNDAQALLILAMNMLGIDSSILPSLSQTMDSELNLDSIKNILPSLDMENPLQMINIIKSIRVENNTLSLVLDGSFISSDERAENMSIKLVTDGQKLVSLDITNIYTGVTNEEHFDLHINFNDFTGITQIDTSKDYKNLSGTEEIDEGESRLIKLVKSVINTASLTDFELNGTLNININVPIIGNLKWNVPVNVQAKIVDGQPEIMATIGAIPVVNLLLYNLNDDGGFGVTNLPKNRMAYIYYKDGYVYFYRHESAGSKSYERKLKAHIDTVMDDILYYVQFLTGFNDDIIGAIRKSLEIEHEVDLGNVIRSFAISDDKQNVNIVLNMQEVTGDSMMGDMGIGLGIVTCSNGKDYIGKINFSMNMPFTSSIQMDMNADDLVISNLEQSIAGNTLDFTNLYTFINDYNYDENVEWTAKNGAWVQAAEREFTVSFETGCDQTFNSITGKYGTEFALPRMGNREIVTDSERTIYRFDGWYSDVGLTQAFTVGIIPRYSITLYAKWTAITQERTVYFFNGENLIDSQYGEAGEALKNVNIPQFIEVEDENHLYKQEFAGWVDEDGIPITKIPTYSSKLYPNYKTYETLTKYTLSFETGVGLPLEERQIFNSYSAEAYLANYDTSNRIINADGVTTTYQFVGWYLDSNFTTEFNFIMPSEDITIFAKWEIVSQVYERKLIIYDNGTPAYSALLEEGSVITLPSTIKIDENTKWFTDSEYSNETTLPSVMPNEDVILHVRNKYAISFNYYVLENGAHTEKQVSMSLYQGESFTLPTQINYEINYDLDGNGEKDKLIAYFFDGYTLEGNNVSGEMTALNRDMIISSNLTIEEADWCKVTFVIEWAVPGGTIGSWWSQKEAPTQIEPVFVLAGSSITGVTLSYTDSLLDKTVKTRDMNTTCQYSYGKNYIYYAVNYNTSGCKNYGTGSGKASTTQINNNTTLYVEWDD